MRDPSLSLGPRLHLARVSGLVGWIIFGLGLVILLAWVGLSAAFMVDAAGRHRAGLDLWVLPLAMGVFFLPFGLILAVKGLQGRVLEVGIHAGGIYYRERSRSVSWTWDDIVSVSWSQSDRLSDVGLGFEVTTRRTARVEIRSVRQGSVLIDERFPDHLALATMVRDTAARNMLPRYEAALAAGRRVYFGGLGIDHWGLHGAVVLPWSDVGQVRWVSEGSWARYAIIDGAGAHRGDVHCPVPNESVLREVLERFGKLVPRARSS